VIPIAIDKIEQDGANDAEERQQGRVLNLQSEHFQRDPLVDEEPNGCEEREEDGYEHAPNAHADVIEVLLHPNNGLPYLNGELLAVVIVHGRL